MHLVGVTRKTVTTIVAPDRKNSFEAMFLGPHSCELPGVSKNKNAAFGDATLLNTALHAHSVSVG